MYMIEFTPKRTNVSFMINIFSIPNSIKAMGISLYQRGPGSLGFILENHNGRARDLKYVTSRTSARVTQVVWRNMVVGEGILSASICVGDSASFFFFFRSPIDR